MDDAAASTYYSAHGINPATVTQADLTTYCASPGFSPCERLGNTFLEELDISTDLRW
jgi:hypothetical protein